MLGQIKFYSHRYDPYILIIGNELGERRARRDLTYVGPLLLTV